MDRYVVLLFLTRSTALVSFNLVVNTVYLAHFLINRPFMFGICNAIFMMGRLVALIFMMWSMVELFQLSVGLQVVMIVCLPHFLLYRPYTFVVFCKSLPYHLIQPMYFHG